MREPLLLIITAMNNDQADKPHNADTLYVLSLLASLKAGCALLSFPPFVTPALVSCRWFFRSVLIAVHSDWGQREVILCSTECQNLPAFYLFLVLWCLQVCISAFQVYIVFAVIFEGVCVCVTVDWNGSSCIQPKAVWIAACCSFFLFSLLSRWGVISSVDMKSGISNISKGKHRSCRWQKHTLHPNTLKAVVS